MKAFVQVLVLLCFAVVHGQDVRQVIYACPMHPEVTSSKPGTCPKCGMALVKKNVAPKPKPRPKPAKKPSVKPSESAPSKQKPAREAAPAAQLHRKSVEEPKVPSKTTYKGKRVRYDLFVRDTMVHYTGKHRHAIAINGTIPAPTLTFTQGDTAEVHVHNMLREATTIHWHGVFLPNRFDGVPYLTQMPIKPGSSYVYKFPILQNGTYWYHSHTGLQEQIGMYGALVFKKPEEAPMPEIPVVISEWTDMMPMEIERRLHTGSDWFGIKKNAVQSYSEAIAAGHLKTKLVNEFKRMEAMDVSDVAYDVFLANGENQKEYPQFRAGQKVKLRIINGGASSYFWLNYAGGKLTVVANDGNDVEPVEVDRLIVGTAETYDVIVTIPQDMSYEFLITPEDRSGSTSIWLGSGMKMPAQKLPKLKYFEGMKMMNSMMDMNGNMEPMGMQMSNQTMDMNNVMYPEVTGGDQPEPAMQTGHEGHAGHAADAGSGAITTLNYGMLKATKNTTLPDAPVRNLHFELTGNMNRYVWTLNNRTVSESDKILIKKGENLRITMFNNSMMRHPMHLHGHDFRLINGQGDFAPMKNTVDVMPMETDTIEFAATESGDWFFHCHILYHMMSGMGRIFEYENSPEIEEITNPKMAQRMLFKDDRRVYFNIENDFATNGNDGMASFSSTRWQLSSEWRLGYNSTHGYEVETHLGRYLGRNQWFMPFIGFDWRYRRLGDDPHEENIFGQRNTKDVRAEFSAGFEYLLPMLFKLSGEVYTDGNVRFTLRREDIPLSRRWRAVMMVNTDREYMAGIRYIAGKYLSPSLHYDSDMGIGIGATFTY